MHDAVLDALSDAFRSRQIPGLRFNFRGVGGSAGTHDDGNGETQDVLAAADVGFAGAAIKAYDVAGRLLDQDVLTGTGEGVDNFGELVVWGPGIVRVELFQPAIDEVGSDVIAFDNMILLVDEDGTFPDTGTGGVSGEGTTSIPVLPLPAQILLGLGLMAVGALRRRRSLR